MVVTSPTWLNASYVQKILRQADKDKTITVSGIIVKPATAKGDNYASEMFRVGVEYSQLQDGRKVEEKKSFLIKVAPQDEVLVEMAIGLFETEFSMMADTLPRMTELLEQAGFSSLAAQCFYIEHKKPGHMVIEDLATKGFKLSARYLGLNLDHTLLAIRHLGNFHGASVSLKEKNPEAFKNYNIALIHKDQHAKMARFFKSNVKVFVNEAATWSELSPRIVEKLVQLSEVAYKKGCEATRYQEDDFNVLNHGDSWINNMLFRYDEEQKPIDHIFVDFQLSYYGSPAIDILYFIATSLSDEVRLYQRELVLREYHESLTSTMVKLKCKTKAPTFEELQEILKKRAFYEVINSMTVLAVSRLEEGVEIDVEDVMKEDDECKNIAYLGKSFRKIMSRLLPWYDSLGLLDA